LEEEEEKVAENQAREGSTGKKEEEGNCEITQENAKQKGIMTNDTEPEMDQEMT